jgi:bifunctional non-homologous end joining protein LigD
VPSSKLSDYRAKRNPARTAEPMPAEVQGATQTGNSFVVQEHHATALHWDFRLERDGVLVSWAVPKGLPTDPRRNHLAVHTEDHPLEYAHFEGAITPGEYGGGQVTIWDEGSYICEKWTDKEVKVVLAGRRTTGRFVLIHTGGKNWIMHRMDGPAKPDWESQPATIAPMLAVPGAMPLASVDVQWAYEMKWDGVRAICTVDGGRITLMSRNDKDMSVSYPELRALGAQLGSTQAILDGEIVAFDDQGRPSFSLLQQRMHVANAAQARRLADSHPVVYLVFDLLYLDGRSLLELPYDTRRELLVDLGLDGPNWQTPPSFQGAGADALRASQDGGLEGVIAKRRTSTYQPGRRSPNWVKIKNIRTQEVIIGGWNPGAGRRSDTFGSLLLGIPGENGLDYVGNVGTGFDDAMLADLLKRLIASERKTSPFGTALPRAVTREARWVTPKLVGEVVFTEWTPDQRLRHPAWRGLRPEKAPADVVRDT